MNLKKDWFFKSKDLLKPWLKHANITHGHKQLENVDSWKSKGTDIYTQHWGVTVQVNTRDNNNTMYTPPGQHQQSGGKLSQYWPLVIGLRIGFPQLYIYSTVQVKENSLHQRIENGEIVFWRLSQSWLRFLH